MNDFLASNLAALEARDRRTTLSAVAPAAAGRLASSVADGIDTADAWLTKGCGTVLPPTIFSVGIGEGYLLDALERRGADVEVVVLEPDPAAARAALSRRDWHHWITTHRLTLLVGPEYTGAAGAWKPTEVPPADPPVLIHPCAGHMAPQDLTRAKDLARRIISEARANAEARRAHAARYLLQTLANAPRIAREGDASSLGNAFTGATAIVVAAGPSLDGQVQAIGEARGRAIVICCDTAARTLLSAGVPPHIILSLDPSESNAMHVSALHAPRNTWLVAEGSLHPSAFPQFDGRTFFFNVSNHHPWPWLGTLGMSRGRLAAWGSVATSALDLAIGMGCSRIVFAGQDLAFTDGRPYCRGTIFEAQWGTWMGTGQSFQAICDMLVGRWPEVMEPDIQGRSVRTAPHLLAFRNWMRERIEAAPDVQFFNATRAGILHHPRIVQAPLARALEGLPPLDAALVEKTFRSAHQRVNDDTSHLLATVDSLLLRRGTSPFREWLQFAMGTIGPDIIEAALRSHEYEAWRCGRASTVPVTYH